jgi:hypothetical protein
VPLGDDFQVNTYTVDNQSFAGAAGIGGGAFVVMWTDFVQDGAGAGIFGQRYDSTGAPAGGEFQVNSYTQGQELLPRLAAAPGNAFIAVWSSLIVAGPLSSASVLGQRFAATGEPIGAELGEPPCLPQLQGLAGVAAGPSGFLIAWSTLDLANSDGEVVAQAFVAGASATPTSTPTVTPTITPTRTPTDTPSNTPTQTPTPTATSTGTPAPNGVPCTTADACVSGFCADGVCCNEACDDPAEICGLSTSLGTCIRVARPVPALSTTALGTALALLAAVAGIALRRARRAR